MKNSQHPDAVELKSLLDYLEGFKAFIQQSAAYFFQLIRKHFIWLLLPLVLATGYGYYSYSSGEALFHLEMQLSYNELYKRTYGEMILRLNEQLANGNHAYVAQQLKMDEEDVKLISSIKGENIARSPLHEDVSEEKLPFYIMADVRDAKIADTLQSGIIYFLKNNPLNQERRRINIVNLKDRLHFLETQLAWMDSIKVNYNNQLKKGIPSDAQNNEMAIDRLFSLSDTFYKEWLGARSGLESYEAVELVFGFTPQTVAQKPSLLKFLSRYLFIGLAISLVMILWLAIPNKSKA